MVVELVILSVSSVFAAWVVLFGGASRLEDTVTSAFLVHPSALYWSATMIRCYVGVGWLGALLLWLL